MRFHIAFESRLFQLHVIYFVGMYRIVSLVLSNLVLCDQADIAQNGRVVMMVKHVCLLWSRDFRARVKDLITFSQ